MSLDDQEQGDPETVGWDEVPASNANLLSEINFEDMTTLGPSAAFSLGQAFNPAGTRDLKFFFGLTDGSLARGIVQYFSASQAGDYNLTGVVDAADFVVWRNTLNQNVPSGSGADGDANGIVEQADYTVWQANFGKTLSAGANLSAVIAVPEPATLSVVMIAVMSLNTCGRRRAQRAGIGTCSRPQSMPRPAAPGR